MQISHCTCVMRGEVPIVDDLDMIFLYLNVVGLEAVPLEALQTRGVGESPAFDPWTIRNSVTNG